MAADFLSPSIHHNNPKRPVPVRQRICLNIRRLAGFSQRREAPALARWEPLSSTRLNGKRAGAAHRILGAPPTPGSVSNRWNNAVIGRSRQEDEGRDRPAGPWRKGMSHSLVGRYEGRAARLPACGPPDRLNYDMGTEKRKSGSPTAVEFSRARWSGSRLSTSPPRSRVRPLEGATPVPVQDSRRRAKPKKRARRRRESHAT